MLIISENRRARFDYNILERFQAGIELSGHETKSAKIRGFNLASAYIIIRDSELFLIGAEIPSFQPKNAPEKYDPARLRRLLLKRGEINDIIGKSQNGLTIIPTKVYINSRELIKLEIALARGRKKSDKRELIKKRESDREIRRSYATRK